MITKIFTKSEGCGFGNKVQFIPVVESELSVGNEVICDDTFYADLGMNVPKSNIGFNRGYFPFGFRRKDMWKIMALHPFAQLYGYKWKLGNKHYSLGGSLINMDHSKTEVENNFRFFF